MEVNIDPKSGFCFGVVNAIQAAEEELVDSKVLYCLGDIVHNSAEVERLKKKGLVIINHEDLHKLKNCKVLIRAHGEPPETYKIALKNNITLVDASCPVVLKLQNSIRLGMNALIKKNGQIVIYGKKNHAEVNGLEGQTLNNAIIVESENDIEKIDFTKPILLYSQTTKTNEGLLNIVRLINFKLNSIENSTKDFIYYNTICSKVSNRSCELKKFATEHDLIIFVSDKKSSNGTALYGICKSVNSNSYFIENKDEIKTEWLKGIKSVGICGATSTPRWAMEDASNEILKYKAIILRY